MITNTLIDNIIQVVISAVTLQWKMQGHSLTGKFARSLEAKTKKLVDGVRIEFFMEQYGLIINQGVSASRIPYRRGSGNTKSKYIQGLTEYAVARFRVSRDVAERIAFAIASKHKQEGMPTRASRRFSKTNKRTEFIDDALKDADDEINRLIVDSLEATVQIIIQKAVQNA